jgi:3D (Asp-Asp-Asp) domain-containing protein
VTALSVVVFALLYEVTGLDSRNPAGLLNLRHAPTRPAPGMRLQFSVTGYCKGTTTTSGVNVRSGIAASDPALLPVGSVVHIERLDERYDGVYTIMDTGPEVKGREIDIYIWSCNEALQLGRRDAAVTVMRLGWNPRSSAPRLIDRLFRRNAEP